MNRQVKKIIEKNKYRSSFYKSKKDKKKHLNIEKKTYQQNSTNKENKNKYSYFLTALLNKVLISMIILFVLLISKKDEKISIIYKTTFKNMNIVKIESFITNRFSGLFPLPDDKYKYVDAPVIDYTNTTLYLDGVIVHLGMGEPVQSSVDGRVIRIYQDEELGKVIVIQDINGHEYHYGYLVDINVKLFESIEYGKTLGIGKSSENLDTYFYLAVMDGETALDVVDIVNDTSYGGL